MAFQLDVLTVGDKSRSGDAMALRFGDLANNQQSVVIIDGGFTASGEALVEHVRTHYGTSNVDLVVSTHPDADHSSGLAVVMEKMTVGRLWMHRPWNHTQDIAKMFTDGRVSDMSVAEGIRKSLDDVRHLERLASKKGVSIEEPFAGKVIGDGTYNFTVLSPTIEFYEDLLLDFRCTPKAKEQSALEMVMKLIAEQAKKVAEKFDIETLREPKGTHAENESSVVMLFEGGGKRVLFTADAGPKALFLALGALATYQIDVDSLTHIQVPHHGSRRNVGPTLLNSLLGPKLSLDARKRIAFVSACPDGAPKHPSAQVLNAYRRRGAHVWGGTGPTVMLNDGAGRAGWTALDPHPLHEEVDDDES